MERSTDVCRRSCTGSDGCVSRSQFSDIHLHSTNLCMRGVNEETTSRRSLQYDVGNRPGMQLAAGIGTGRPPLPDGTMAFSNGQLRVERTYPPPPLLGAGPQIPSKKRGRTKMKEISEDIVQQGSKLLELWPLKAPLQPPPPPPPMPGSRAGIPALRPGLRAGLPRGSCKQGTLNKSGGERRGRT